MSYDNTNRGAIWGNQEKREGKQDPDYTGSLNVDGKDYWVKAWKRRPDAKPNSPALSFAVKPKDGERAPRPKDEPEDFDDDLPFSGEAA